MSSEIHDLTGETAALPSGMRMFHKFAKEIIIKLLEEGKRKYPTLSEKSITLRSDDNIFSQGLEYYVHMGEVPDSIFYFYCRIPYEIMEEFNEALNAGTVDSDPNVAETITDITDLINSQLQEIHNLIEKAKLQ